MANSFGNPVNRILSTVSKNYSGVLSDGGDQEGPLSPNNPLDANFIAEVNSLLAQYIEALGAVKIRADFVELGPRLSTRGIVDPEFGPGSACFISEKPYQAEIVKHNQLMEVSHVHFLVLHF